MHPAGSNSAKRLENSGVLQRRRVTGQRGRIIQRTGHRLHFRAIQHSVLGQTGVGDKLLKELYATPACTGACKRDGFLLERDCS